MRQRITVIATTLLALGLFVGVAAAKVPHTGGITEPVRYRVSVGDRARTITVEPL